MTKATCPRAFRVHPRDGERHDGRSVEATSVELAAVAFLETCGPMAEAPGEIRLIVVEVETGHEHCFSIDMATGAAQPCG